MNHAAAGLPQLGTTASPWIAFMLPYNRPAELLADEDGPYVRPFTQAQAERGPWPRYEALLPPEARARIAQLYAVDYTSYLANAPVGRSEAAA